MMQLLGERAGHVLFCIPVIYMFFKSKIKKQIGGGGEYNECITCTLLFYFTFSLFFLTKMLTKNNHFHCFFVE